MESAWGGFLEGANSMGIIGLLGIEATMKNAKSCRMVIKSSNGTLSFSHWLPSHDVMDMIRMHSCLLCNEVIGWQTKNDLKHWVVVKRGPWYPQRGEVTLDPLSVVD